MLVHLSAVCLSMMCRLVFWKRGLRSKVRLAVWMRSRGRHLTGCVVMLLLTSGTFSGQFEHSAQAHEGDGSHPHVHVANAGGAAGAGKATGAGKTTGAGETTSGDSADANELAAANSFMTTRPSAVVLPPPKSGDDVFHFVVFGDRTGGVPAGLKVLEQAVADTNLLDPDLVMTVGDLIQGYSDSPPWMRQMHEYKAIVNRLNMKWYPVAGNHDIYWRGETAAPPGHHESNYEKHFGPLWYSFRHKNAGFVVLYSDEGDPVTNLKDYRVGALQNMSPEQLAFLDKALADLSDADHVFVFLHHPRWIGGGYTGSNWPVVERKLVDAGNVSAVFAGHIHHMRYDGPTHAEKAALDKTAQDDEHQDAPEINTVKVIGESSDASRPVRRNEPVHRNDIEYYTLGATGAGIAMDVPDAGYLHHFNMVTVRQDRITVAALPVGSVIDPQQFTPEFLAEVDQARKLRVVQTSPALLVNADGSCEGVVTLSLQNPTAFPVDVTLSQAPASYSAHWIMTLDHQHFEIPAGGNRDVAFRIWRDVSVRDVSTPGVSVPNGFEPGSDDESMGAETLLNVPAVSLVVEAKTSSVRVRLPEAIQPIELALGQVPADYFNVSRDRCLHVDGDDSAVRVESDAIELPDGPMTLEAWVRPQSLPGYRAIAAKTESSEFAIFSDEGVPEFSIHLGGRYVVAKAIHPMKAGRWTHLAGVYDGESVSLFVDGERVANQSARTKSSEKTTQSLSQRHNRLPFFIGADPNPRGNPTRSFHGWIDEVRLSSAAVYGQAFAPPLRHVPGEETVFLYHFDRSVGPFVLDHSNHAATGWMGPSSELADVSGKPTQ